MPTLSHTVTPMAKKPLSSKPPHGQALVLRRDELGLSLDKVVDLSGGVLDRQRLWRMENGEAHPRTLPSDVERALAAALQWAVPEYREKMGLDPLPDSIPEEEVQATTYKIGEYDIPFIDAGAGLPQWNDDPSSTITVRVPETKGRSPKEMFGVRIVGMSMLPYARHGDIVVFERARVADVGKVVAVHIPDDGLIVKRYLGVAKSGLLLLSNDNPEIAPKVFEAPDGAVIFGASLGSWQPDP